jgi:putative endonuclease
MPGGWIYVVTNRPNGTLYVGVTRDLARRVWEHRAGLADGFTRRYGLKRLVHIEYYDDIRIAIQREKNIKHWPRLWKLRAIAASNPSFRYEQINDGCGANHRPIPECCAQAAEDVDCVGSY